MKNRFLMLAFLAGSYNAPVMAMIGKDGLTQGPTDPQELVEGIPSGLYGLGRRCFRKYTKNAGMLHLKGENSRAKTCLEMIRGYVFSILKFLPLEQPPKAREIYDELDGLANPPKDREGIPSGLYELNNGRFRSRMEDAWIAHLKGDDSSAKTLLGTLGDSHIGLLPKNQHGQARQLYNQLDALIHPEGIPSGLYTFDRGFFRTHMKDAWMLHLKGENSRAKNFLEMIQGCDFSVLKFLPLEQQPMAREIYDELDGLVKIGDGASESAQKTDEGAYHVKFYNPNDEKSVSSGDGSDTASRKTYASFFSY
jgi:hypothetical protein